MLIMFAFQRASEWCAFSTTSPNTMRFQSVDYNGLPDFEMDWSALLYSDVGWLTSNKISSKKSIHDLDSPFTKAEFDY